MDTKTNNYWNNSGKYQELADKLQTLIPSIGPVDNWKRNPMLERFRKASNCYYDLYNNGGINRGRAISRYFPNALRNARDRNWTRVYSITEPMMDEIILFAAKEQKIAPVPQENV